MDMTIRKIYDTFGVSRRAIQGYEKAGLIFASGKNERGHLLYNETAQERIRQIKFFQQAGFSIKEITDIIDAPNNILRPALEERLQLLSRKMMIAPFLRPAEQTMSLMLHLKSRQKSTI